MNGHGDNVEELDEFRRHRAARRQAFRDKRGNDADPLELVRAVTGLPIVGLLRCGDDSFDLQLSLDGDEPTRVPLGDSAGVLEPRIFERKVSNRTGLTLPERIGPAAWHEVGRALLAIAEVEDSGSTEADETLAWIASYLRMFGAREFDRADNASTFRVLDVSVEEEPLRDRQGRLYVPTLQLGQHVVRSIGQSITTRELAVRLGRLGFRNHRIKVESEGEVRRRRTFRSPQRFDPEAEGGRE